MVQDDDPETGSPEPQTTPSPPSPEEEIKSGAKSSVTSTIDTDQDPPNADGSDKKSDGGRNLFTPSLSDDEDEDGETNSGRREVYWSDLAVEFLPLKHDQLQSASAALKPFTGGVYFVQSQDWRLSGLRLPGLDPTEIALCDLCRTARSEPRLPIVELVYDPAGLIGEACAAGKKALIVFLGRDGAEWASEQMPDGDFDNLDLAGLTHVLFVADHWDDRAVDHATRAKAFEKLDDVEELAALASATGQFDTEDLQSALRTQIQSGNWSDLRLGGDKSAVQGFLTELLEDPKECFELFKEYAQSIQHMAVSKEWAEAIGEISSSGHPAKTAALFLLVNIKDMSIGVFEDLVPKLAREIAPERVGKDDPPPPVDLTNDVYSDCQIRVLNDPSPTKPLRVELRKARVAYARQELQQKMRAATRRLELSLVDHVSEHLDCDSCTYLIDMMIRRLSDDGRLSSDEAVGQYIAKAFLTNQEPERWSMDVLRGIRNFMDQWIQQVALHADGEKDPAAIGRRLRQQVQLAVAHRAQGEDGLLLCVDLCAYDPEFFSETLLPASLRSWRERRNNAFSPLLDRLFDTMMNRGSERQRKKVNFAQLARELPFVLAGIGKSAQQPSLHADEGGQDNPSGVFLHPFDWGVFEVVTRHWMWAAVLAWGGNQADWSFLKSAHHADLRRDLRRYLAQFLANETRNPFGIQTGTGSVQHPVRHIRKIRRLCEAENIDDVAGFQRQRFYDSFELLSGRPRPMLHFVMFPGFIEERIGLSEEAARDHLAGAFGEEGVGRIEGAHARWHLSVLAEAPVWMALAVCHERDEDSGNLMRSEAVAEIVAGRTKRGDEKVARILKDAVNLLTDDLSWLSQYFDLRWPDRKQGKELKNLANFRRKLVRGLVVSLS